MFKKQVPNATTSAAATTDQDELVLDQDVEQLKAQAAEHLAGWQRAKADYVNLEKNWQERQKQFLDLAKAAMVLELLPIVDHFQLAVDHIPNQEQSQAWVQGIIHIKREVEQFLEKLGVQAIEPSSQFDPSLHEAITHELSDQPSGTILRQIKPGYQMNGQVIQPTQVVVSSGPTSPLAANPPPAEDSF